jgi:hypothetical protein
VDGPEGVVTRSGDDGITTDLTNNCSPWMIIVMFYLHKLFAHKKD